MEVAVALSTDRLVLPKAKERRYASRNSDEILKKFLILLLLGCLGFSNSMCKAQLARMIVAPGTRIFRQKFLNFQELKIYSLGCHLYSFVDNLGSLFVLTFVHCTVFLYFFYGCQIYSV